MYDHPQFQHYITEIQGPDRTSPVRTEYDDNGRIIATVDAFGHRVEVDWDVAARRETTYDKPGNPSVQIYNTRGNIIATTDPLGRTTIHMYDVDNNEISFTDALGHTRRFTYDGAGNRLSVSDPLTNTTSFSYDEYGTG